MGVDHDHQRRVRRLLWVLLVFASATSLAGNVTHALTQQRGVDSIGPIAAAALAPVALLGLTHLLGLWSSIHSRDLIFWCILTGIATLAAAAFRLSFDALRTLAVLYGYGHSDAALFPLILDGLVAVCTLGLVGLTRLTGSAVVHTDAPATQTHVTQTQPAAVPVTQPVKQRMQPLTEAAASAPAPAATPAAPQPVTPATTQPVLAAAATGPEPDAGPNGSPATTSRGGTDAHLALAQRLVKAGRTNADVVTVRSVLRHEAVGASSRAIAETVGLSASSVQRIVKAAREAR